MGVHIDAQKHANCFDQVFLSSSFLPQSINYVNSVVPKLFYMVAQFQGCKNFAAPLLQSRRHGGGFGGLSPPKQSAKPPK